MAVEASKAHVFVYEIEKLNKNSSFNEGNQNKKLKKNREKLY